MGLHRGCSLEPHLRVWSVVEFTSRPLFHFCREVEATYHLLVLNEYLQHTAVRCMQDQRNVLFNQTLTRSMLV